MGFRKPYYYNLRSRGFTLIELLMVIAITVILAKLAAGSFSKSIHDNRVTSYTNGLIAGLNLTRNTAIQRGNYVIMCATDDPTASTPACTSGSSWANGWLVYSSATVTGTPTSNSLIKVGDSSGGGVTTSGTAATKIVFTSRGIIYGASVDKTIIVKATNCTSGKDSMLTINLGSVGRTYTTAGTCP